MGTMSPPKPAAGAARLADAAGGADRASAAGGVTTASPVPASASAAAAAQADRARRHRLALVLPALMLLGLLAGLATGTQGLAPASLWADLHAGDAWLIVGEIRAPRTIGAALVGALLGLAGAVAQGLFRNPLADPYLIGIAPGAGLGVVLLLAGTAAGGAAWSLATLEWVERVGLVGAAFAGALAGVAMTLALAGGAVQTMRLLLAGIVVGVLLGAMSDLVTVASPDALRGKQAFMLGSTSYLGWPALALLGAGLTVLAVAARRLSRVLDALTLGEDSAASLGLDLARLRLALVLVLSLGTALAVAQAGLVAFVGLVAPHVVRRAAPGPHGWLLGASAAMGGVLLLGADVLSRALIAPHELPVGVVTAVLGGGYLFWLLRRERSR